MDPTVVRRYGNTNIMYVLMLEVPNPCGVVKQVKKIFSETSMVSQRKVLNTKTIQERMQVKTLVMTALTKLGQKQWLLKSSIGL